MEYQKFMKLFNEDINMSKEIMKSRNDELIFELNDYKKMLEEELLRSKIKDNNIYNYDRKNDCNNEEIYNKMTNENLVEDIIRMDEEGGSIDFNNLDSEGYEALESLSMSDPLFALEFLERRKDNIPKEKYEDLKNKLLMNLNIKN